MIFELLFTDAEFVKSVRSKVNEKTWQFTKKEIVAVLQSITEDTVWNNLLGTEAVTSLSENFLTVKNYRNDVMHAHNIDTETYREAKKLFSEINGQLDSEIDLIIKKAEESPEETADSAFNEALNTALAAQNATSLLKQARDSIIEFSSVRPDGMREFLRQMQEYYATSYDYTQLQTSMKPILDLYSDSEYAQLQNTLREFAAFQKSPEYGAWKKQLQEIATIAESLRHSTGLTKPEKKDDHMNDAPEANSDEEQTDREENGNA